MVKNEEITSVAVEITSAFSKIVRNLKIQEKFADNNFPHNLLSHPTLHAMLKYKDHPNIRVIKRFSQRFSSFYFSPVVKSTALKENESLIKQYKKQIFL